MKGILDLLARAKLVELSEEEKLATAERQAFASPADLPPPAPPASPASWPAPEAVTGEEAPAPLPPATSPVSPPIAEARGFDAIFAAAGLPEVPFPAEKLLRLLDGLRAMDAVTRKAAVLAMDAADDNWQIGDCVDDARRKIGALQDYKQQLARQLQIDEQQAAEKLAQVRAGLDTASAAIRQQIAELEQLLERKIAQTAQEAGTIEAEMRAAREALTRETRRMDAEIERLNEIPQQFAAPATA